MYVVLFMLCYRRSCVEPVRGRCTLRNADCGMQKFEKVYIAEFHLRNVPQITS